MLLKSLSIDVTPACIDYGIDLDDVRLLRDCSELLSWKLSLWIQTRRLELPNAARVEVFGASHRKGAVLTQSNADASTLLVGIAVDRDAILATATASAAYAVLFGLVRDGMDRASRKYGLNIDGLENVLAEFEQDDFEMRHNLAERRPRVLGLTFRLEGRAKERLLKTSFLILRNGGEIYREELGQCSVWSFRRNGGFGKIEFDGETVSFSKRLFREDTVPPLASETAPTVKPPTHRLTFFDWSRRLSDLMKNPPPSTGVN